MKRSARSVFVFALYLFVLGLILLIVPNLLLRLFGFPETNEVWVRIVGMLVVVLGFYYLQAARNGLTPFYWATVWGRCSVLVFFTAFVLLGFAPPVLVLFGVVDVIGAIWTAFCLRAESAEAA